MELERQSEQGDVSNYQPNGEFDLVNFSAHRNVEFYSCCPEPYPDITYEIRLKRRPMFYVFNLILPCVLINGIGKHIINDIQLNIIHLSKLTIINIKIAKDIFNYNIQKSEKEKMKKKKKLK